MGIYLGTNGDIIGILWTNNIQKGGSENRVFNSAAGPL